MLPQTKDQKKENIGPVVVLDMTFVKSKPAGERLLRMVKCVLENDEPKSWLDYREHEPDWIQFKFQKEEFDLEKLDDLARKNNDIITIDILKQCVKEIEELTE